MDVFSYYTHLLPSLADKDIVFREGLSESVDAILSRIRSDGRGQNIILFGDRGAGKSVFVKWIFSKHHQKWGSALISCSIDKKNDLLYPLQEFFRYECGLSEESSPNDNYDTLVSFCESHRIADEDALAFLPQYLNFPFPPESESTKAVPEKIKRQAVVDFCSDLFVKLAGKKGAIIVVEDFQWGDQLTNNIVRKLSSTVPNHNICLILTCRTDIKPRLEALIDAMPLKVQPLSDDVAGNESQRNGNSSDEDVRIENILLQNGIVLRDFEGIIKDDETEILADDGLLYDIGKLDESKYTLQLIAAVGKTVTERFLAELFSNEGQLHRDISTLVSKAFLIREDAPNGPEYSFPSDAHWKAATASQTTTQRKENHKRIAKLLSEKYESTTPTAILAKHFCGHGNYQKGVEYFLAAAETELSRNRIKMASNFLKSAIRAMPHTTHSPENVSIEITLWLKLAACIQVHNHAGHEDVAACYLKVVDLCRSAKHDLEVAGLLGLIRFLLHRSALSDCKLLFDVVSKWPSDVGGSVKCFTRFLEGEISFWQSNFPRTIDLFEALLGNSEMRSHAAGASQLFYADPVAASYAYLSIANTMSCNFEESFTNLDKAIEIAKIDNTPFLKAQMLGMASVAHDLILDYTSASRYNRETSQLCNAGGFIFPKLLVEISEATHAVSRSDSSHGINLLKDAVFNADKTGAVLYKGIILPKLAIAYAVNGKLSESAGYLNQSEQFFTNNPDHPWRCEYLRIRPIVEQLINETKNGNPKDFNIAIQLSQSTGNKLFELMTLISKRESSLEARDTEDLNAFLKTIHAPRNIPILERAKPST